MMTDDGSPRLEVPRSRPPVFEFVAVMALGVVPHLIYAVDGFTSGSSAGRSFRPEMMVLIVGSLQILLPLLYIMSRSGVPWAEFGVRRPRLVVDPLLAIAVMAAVLVIPPLVLAVLSPLLDLVLGDPDPTYAYSGPDGVTDYAILLLAMTCNSFAEEFVVRGYLIPRLRRFGATAIGAVVISSLLWGAYHVYQGPWAMVWVTISGLVFGGAFVITGRIWPLVIAHTLENLYVFAVNP